jgi:putative oxidoreductase
MAALGLLILRLCIAAVLVLHGSHQLLLLAGATTAEGMPSPAADFALLGLEPPFGLAVLAALTQLVGGLLVGGGLLLRWASVAVIGYLGIIIWKIQSHWGWSVHSSVDPTRGRGIELPALIMGVLVALMLTGAGDWSLDGRRARRDAARAAGRARLRTRA